jgi:hypothetical protein
MYDATVPTLSAFKQYCIHLTHTYIVLDPLISFCDVDATNHIQM